MNNTTHNTTTTHNPASTTTTSPTFYTHCVSGDIQTLEEWQTEDFTSEWLETQEQKKEMLSEIRPEYEWFDQPTPSPAEIIQEYIDCGFLIEVRRTETQAEKDTYGEWMEA